MSPTMNPRALAAVLCVFLAFGCEARSRTGQDSEGDSANVVVDAGCPHSSDGTCAHEEAPPRAANEAPPKKASYGAPLGQSPSVSLAHVLSSPNDFNQKTVRLEGHVRRACSRKGCWMELATDAKPDSPSCRVTFKDYGFLVPTDSAGSQAKLEGVVQVTEVKKEAVEHYESEGASFPNKRADGTALEVRLVANGVELERI
jgi:hypothetical protein